MKKQYGVAQIDQKEYVAAAAKTGSSSRVDRPILKFDGDFNPKIMAGEFALPSTDECKDASIEVAHRILGFLVTDPLLAHTPSTVTSEHVGTLLAFFPFSYHKRFGATYTDRVCPGSTRTGRCPVCDGRKELFTSDMYKNAGSVGDQKRLKDQFMKAGFGTRQTALVISRVYYNGEDLGIRAWTTLLTNEKAENAKHDNFFDLVDQLTTPKKLLAGEVLPKDYYSNGDGARWLIAEYVRATYQDESDTKSPPRPYWKLSKVSPTKEIPGVGKACDIWWPEFGKGKDAKDGTELVDVYAMLNHTPAEELAEAAKESVDRLLHPKRPAGQQAAERAADEPVKYAEEIDPPTWADIVNADVEELVRYGVAKGGVAHDLNLTGAANMSALRLCVAKLWKVTPKPASQPLQPADDTSDGPTPF